MAAGETDRRLFCAWPIQSRK